ncbi:MAG TPA: hypothetical protein PLJ42_05195 [Chitinophagales bacterium]|jgi:hypothetical protein|nr:hypothetical protein [Chitinophagales bacterium]HQW78812.1 hypothetical protein [Chitinophagales bacterium]HRB92114.1 hypothetical protein [Chitinophagales bacterium]
MKNLWLLFILSIFIFSCKKTAKEPKDTCEVEITQVLKNPYELPIETSSSKKIITHQYVKFYLQTMEEYKQLEAQGAVLLDHPFNAVPDKNLHYQTEHTLQYGIYYGVVPKGVSLAAYQTEKISDLYMPDNHKDERISDLEEKEFSGSIRFFDPVAQAQIPLEGAQIMIKDGTRTIFAISDSVGNFSVRSNAISTDTAEILIKFDNPNLEIHTLDNANILGIFGVNTYSFGYKKACAFTSLHIVIDNKFNNAALHHSCATLHAYNQFKKFANQFNYIMPSKKMIYWIGKDAPISTSYAAPMLQNMSLQSIDHIEQLFTNLLGVPANMADLLAIAVRSQLPDIYAPFYSTYSTVARISFLETLFHELAHSSHFSKVGSDFWMPYVEYIYKNGGYGEPFFANAGMVAVSEAWAEDVSNIGLNYIYGKQAYINLNENPPTDWIPYGIYHDLYDNGTNEVFDQVSGITFPEIYNLLQNNIQSLSALKTSLKTNYPSQQTAIDLLFAHYGY